VLDFRQNSSSRAKETRREQHRIVFLLLMCGLLYLMVDKVRDPAIWRLLDRMASPTQEVKLQNLVDNRLDDADEGESGDTVLVADERAIPKQKSPKKPTAGYFPGVVPEELENIRDDKPSQRSETACSLRLFDLLRRTDSQELHDASTGRVTYAQLFRQPNDYRGRLVTVSGTVRRAQWIAVAANEYGIKEYCQLWLWPSDNPSSPMILYCLKLPKGFPIGQKIAEDVELTGFFFKWNQRPEMVQEKPVEEWPLGILIGIAAVAAVVAAWAVYRRTQAAPLDLPKRLPKFQMPKKAVKQKKE
jgi:hypothetical protein